VTTLLHLSDIHGGRPFVARAAEAAIEAAHRLAPDAVVVSGDLVQRADFRSQWEVARAFLARLPRPLIVCPGNHDIPVFNPFARLFTPHARFREYVGPEIEPALDVAPRAEGRPGLSITALCSPARLLFDRGWISAAQLARAEGRLRAAPAGALRVAVLHHPLLPQPRETGPFAVHCMGHRRAVRRLALAGAEVVLSGHNHFPRAVTLEAVAPEGRTLVLAQSGTTTSRRLRPWTGHATQAFNVIRADASELVVEPWLLGEKGFAPGQATRFPRHPRP